MSTDWRHAIITASATVRDAMRAIEAAHIQIAFVTDEADIVIGTITDGDVRRGLLAGSTLDAPASHVMKRGAVTAQVGADHEQLVSLMRREGVRQVPLVDDRGRIVDVRLLDGAFAVPERPNEAILMVGGLGSRLGELTAHTPKPLLHVGRRPLLETILERLIEHGIRRFHFAVNYRAEMIRTHFGDGTRWGVRIDYVQEPKRMGTAGALALLSEPPSVPFIVMNGDVLTTLDFSRLLEHHTDHRAAATIAVRDYTTQVPFGVVEVHGHKVVDIVEKPVLNHYVSAGVYVLDPLCLDFVRARESLDMPELLQRLMAANKDVVHYEVHEYWRDVGRPDDLEAAHAEYREHFEPAKDASR
ncbi:MAG: nucleotidyltransferase family protein [Trueperaceae bacterium]|nr:nucleotidyltransferase family protein [Trueperaceae bacterium]